ncbi:hypothetical protein AOLI_G00090110 [Acnodon oligacanthus]
MPRTSTEKQCLGASCGSSDGHQRAQPLVGHAPSSHGMHPSPRFLTERNEERQTRAPLIGPDDPQKKGSLLVPSGITDQRIYQGFPDTAQQSHIDHVTQRIMWNG